MALPVDDLDGWRTLGDFERLNRGQVGSHPHGTADSGDHQPKADDRAPINNPAEAAAPGYDIDTVMAGILVLTAFSLALDALVGVAEKALMKWQPKAGESEKL